MRSALWDLVLYGLWVLVGLVIARSAIAYRAKNLFYTFVRLYVIAFFYIVSKYTLEPQGSHHCLGREYTYPQFLPPAGFYGVLASGSGVLLLSLNRVDVLMFLYPF